MSQANRFGSRFTISSFGESHGKALGVLIDGMPAGVDFNEDLLKKFMSRRRPGSSNIVSARNEEDSVEILSGIFESKTLGTPILGVVFNHDQRSEDYRYLAPRRGHADLLWQEKFGNADFRGGGRSSGRETLARVIGGSFAKMFCTQVLPRINVCAFAQRIGPFELQAGDRVRLEQENHSDFVDRFAARFPSQVQSPLVEKLLLDAKSEGKSYGGVAELWVDNLPKGLGQPVFHKLKSDIATAMMSIGATLGIEFGDGFLATQAEGSEFHQRQEGDHYGGIQGGMSNGERIILRVAYKPTSSVLDVAKKGRHDPCIVPRAIPVMEAMIWCVIADHLLWQRSDRV